MNSLWCPEMNVMYYKAARDFAKTEMTHKIMECGRGETMKYCHKYDCKWNIQGICEGGEECMSNSKDVLKAAKVIKEYCKSIPNDCNGCIFYYNKLNRLNNTLSARGCRLHDGLPETWEIEKVGDQDAE